jgi:hypothetical protein
LVSGIEAKLLLDMKAALKSGEEGRLDLSVIRLARAALQNAAIEKRRELSEEEAVEVLSREVKQRREAADEYTGLGRKEAADRLHREVSVLERYLPEQLSEEELRRLITQAITETGASSARDLGKVMGKVVPQTRGRAAGRKVKELAGQLLPEG